MAAANLVAGIGAAVTGMASITILVGALVLSAVIGANRRAQQYNAVIFKVLGARVNAFGCVSNGIWRLGLATALVRAFIGSVAAWAIVTFNEYVLGIPTKSAPYSFGVRFGALGVGF